MSLDRGEGDETKGQLLQRFHWLPMRWKVAQFDITMIIWPLLRIVHCLACAYKLGLRAKTWCEECFLHIRTTTRLRWRWSKSPGHPITRSRAYPVCWPRMICYQALSHSWEVGGWKGWEWTREFGWEMLG